MKKKPKKQVKKQAQRRDIPRTHNTGYTEEGFYRAVAMTQEELEERERIKRTIAQKRQKRRRKKAAFRFFLLFCCLLVVGATVAVSIFFKIDTIRFEGEITAYTAQQIEGGCPVSVGENLFRFKAGEVQEALYRKFPLLDDIQVGRTLPTTVTITAKDAVARTAVKQEGGGYTLLSESGRIMAQNQASLPEGVYVISGVKAKQGELGETLQFDDPDKLPLLEGIHQAVSAVGLEGLQSVDLSDTQNISLRVGKYFLVKLGSDYQLEYKLQLVREIIVQKDLSPEPTILDASIPGKVTAKTGTAAVQALEAANGAAGGEQQPPAEEPAPEGGEEAPQEGETPAQQPEDAGEGDEGAAQ
ncbi:cell division protein FtsQ/DivIB [Bittarella massiliensis (ex Durand et al. 2017)]|uniref:FtsQ-type POTRA domain-containing protein n=1 Tax=Bittarella massiliensis (ex Durand et al. 2017) TaxID=1720313 RepID=A0AAW5KG81_9FIRM|nr:FtsQ-type POTRA domain-containing protein [Bittarella massiliensis (ex Durand et al. 2017)]MCQ4949719.1 FtsQ-type POTRA domain-containing protein [Bittarella massiliensis (ex Durand et al. 2017)]